MKKITIAELQSREIAELQQCISAEQQLVTPEVLTV
jgi:hypothetical protein